MGKRQDITGQIFGKWTVLSYTGRISSMSLYRCKCECGTERDVDRHRLVYGTSRSCGCARNSAPKNPYKTHGMWNTRLYKAWENMKSRCRKNSNYEYAHNYSDRGITYCSEWETFVNFRDWALSNGYAENLELDRIDVNGNYCPENCRWVTKKENANNKRTNRYITIDGETKTLTQWCEIKNIKLFTVLYRVKSKSWSYEKALTTPLMRGGRKKDNNEAKIS